MDLPRAQAIFHHTFRLESYYRHSQFRNVNHSSIVLPGRVILEEVILRIALEAGATSSPDTPSSTGSGLYTPSSTVSRRASISFSSMKY